MDMSGTWYNELGSVMELRASDGTLIGKYSSGVSTDGDPTPGEYGLVGKYDLAPTTSTSVGWVVDWENDQKDYNSVTTWSGQYFKTSDGERIVTMWLLTSETERDNDWESTLVGKDVFTRDKPDKQAILSRKPLIAASHPIGRRNPTQKAG